MMYNESEKIGYIGIYDRPGVQSDGGGAERIFCALTIDS